MVDAQTFEMDADQASAGAWSIPCSLVHLWQSSRPAVTALSMQSDGAARGLAAGPR